MSSVLTTGDLPLTPLAPSSRHAGIAPPPAGGAHDEMRLAIGNAFKLGSSLVGTIIVAFVVRFFLPRFLGPEAFGTLHFAEQFPELFFVLTTMGVDTYIAKELAVRPHHADDFFGGVMVIRAMASALLFGAMVATLIWMGKPPETIVLVVVFGVVQVLMTANTSCRSLLYARGTVDELSIVNVAAKLLWGGAVIGVLLAGWPLIAVALVFVAVELGKGAVYWWAVRKHMTFRLKVDLLAARVVVVSSLPYFLNAIAQRIYSKIDVSMISAFAGDAEVGWYGAAANMTAILLLIMPAMQAVVFPMSSRLAQRSQQALEDTMTQVVRIILMLTVPVAFLLAVNASDIVRLVYGAPYAHSVGSLIILAPLVPISYLCVLYATHLIQIGRVWRFVGTTVVSCVLNPLLNYFFIPSVHRALGAGGAGIAASAATVVTEFLVVFLLVSGVGLRDQVRRLAGLTLRLAVTCGAVAAVHHHLTPTLGVWRALTDSLIYLGVGSSVGAIPIREIRSRVLKYLADRRCRAGGP